MLKNGLANCICITAEHLLNSRTFSSGSHPKKATFKILAEKIREHAKKFTGNTRQNSNVDWARFWAPEKQSHQQTNIALPTPKVVDRTRYDTRCMFLCVKSCSSASSSHTYQVNVWSCINGYYTNLHSLFAIIYLILGQIDIKDNKFTYQVYRSMQYEHIWHILLSIYLNS